MYFYRDIADYFKVTFDYLFNESLGVKTNYLIDSVVLKMSYMNVEEQKYVLDMVERFSSFTEKQEDKK